MHQGRAPPLRAQRPGAARDVSAPRPGLRSQKAARAAAEVRASGSGSGVWRNSEACAAAGGGGAMTLFHFGNCFALAYFPYFITYKCSGL